jgi:hypothetical protein
VSLNLLNNGLTITSNGELLPTRSLVLAGASGNSIANASATTVIFAAEYSDTLNEYNNGTGVFTASRAGKFIVSWSTAGNYSAGWEALEEWTTSLYKNDTSAVDSRWIGFRNVRSIDADGYSSSSGSAIVNLAANDTLRIKIYQNSDGAITLLTDTRLNYFNIVSIA